MVFWQMMRNNKEDSGELAAHFFRNQYGKLVSVIARYLGTGDVQTAEDIVQETLLKAVDHWQHRGIPENPQAWLYTTAKNLTLNILKRRKYQLEFENQLVTIEQNFGQLQQLEFSEEIISDEQLRMMFVCCHPSISESSQVALILKILCGFSITEIANAFFISKEATNKRLVRGRRFMRESGIDFASTKGINKRLEIVLKAIFLLFNEGYSPTQKNQLVRPDLCLEAIRLTKILIGGREIEKKSNCYALLALMYFNVSRFGARMNAGKVKIEMHRQDRQDWDQDLINIGVESLNQAVTEDYVSTYLILATISAHHCIASSYDKTDWKEILTLYDSLLVLEDTPLTRLNRMVALAKVEGNIRAITELKVLENETSIGKNYLYHATLAELYGEEQAIEKAISSYKHAIALATNERDIKYLQKKMMEVVPTS